MTEWISVKNRLPEEYKKVLSYNGYEMKIDYIVNAPEPIWACQLAREENNVTHWMPLPESPKMDKEIIDNFKMKLLQNPKRVRQTDGSIKEIYIQPERSKREDMEGPSHLPDKGWPKKNAGFP